MTDIAIIGKGPAGWSCAMTARMRGLSATVIAPLNDTGLLRTAERVDNYPGLPQVSGTEMLNVFRKQALELGAEEKNGLVRQIMALDGHFMLLVENDVMEAKTVVLAMGAARPVLLPGCLQLCRCSATCLRRCRTSSRAPLLQRKAEHRK